MMLVNAMLSPPQVCSDSVALQPLPKKGMRQLYEDVTQPYDKFRRAAVPT